MCFKVPLFPIPMRLDGSCAFLANLKSLNDNKLLIISSAGMKAGWMNFVFILGEVQLPCLKHPPETLFNIEEINIHS